MNASLWFWRLLCAAGVVGGLCLAGPSWAQSKKASDKGTDEKNVIVIQLDVSKAPPALVKQLLELAKSSGKDDTKSGKKDDADDKKKSTKKDDDDNKKKDDKKGDDKKTDTKKPNIVQVDLNKLPPGLAKQVLERAVVTGKSDDKKKDDDKNKSKKDDDDDDKKKKSSKKDDDDDDKKKSGKKKDD